MKQITSHIAGEWSPVDGQERDAVEFYTQEKVIVEGRPLDCSRKF